MKPEDYDIELINSYYEEDEDGDPKWWLDPFSDMWSYDEE